MTAQPGPGPQTPPKPSGLDNFFSSLRRIGIWRTDDRWAGGVAAGLAHRLGIDPLIVRGIFVVLTLFVGVGLLLYGVAWALLPEASDGRIHFQEACRGNFQAGFFGALVAIILGLGRPGFWVGTSWMGALWMGVVLTVIVIVLLATLAAKRPPNQPYSTSQPPMTPPGAGQSTPGAPGQPAPGAAGGTGTPPPAPGSVPMGAPDWSASTPQDAPEPSSAAGSPLGTSTSTPRGHHGTAYQRTQPAGYTAQPMPTPPVVKPRKRGPGPVLAAVVVALCFLATAAMMLLQRTTSMDLAVAVPVSIGVVLLLLGLGILIAGAIGRKGGVLSALAILSLIFGLPVAAISAAAPELGSHSIHNGAVMSSTTWTPTTIAQAKEGFTIAAGSATIDLSKLPANTGTVEVPINAAFGSATITVPSDRPVEVVADVAMGSLNSDTPAGWSRSDSSDESVADTVTLRSPAVQEGQTPQLKIRINAAFGDVNVNTEGAS